MNENFRFKDLPYVRPDFAKVKTELAAITEKMKNAASYEEAKAAYFDFESIMSDLRDAYTIVSIRHTVDTRDKFYDDENEFLSEAFPELSPYTVAFSNALYDGKFKADFEKEFGKQLLSMIELERKSFSEKNIPLQQKEAKLCNEYEKIIASAEIDFDGEKRNLYGVMKYFEDEDREVRKAAWKKYEEFFASHEKRFEEIWDELIKVRNEQGRNLGFENFIPLGYMQQGRTDYNAADVASFREQVKEELVPLCSKLYEAQAKRLNLDKVRVYDENCVFADGNATPIGNDDELVEIAREMYKDMSKETGEFIDFMIDHELLDLKNKPGKASTGYMTSILKYKAPFVFSCFNGTIGDIQVLTHELGHAFAGYEAMRNQPIADYYSESTDIAEIHSMSMEQFAYPYAEKFFGDKADKFRFQHLQEAITFVPFGVAVDEYQHIVYAHPEITPKERTAEWKKLEAKYMPWRDYDGMEFFARGGWWYHKIHIFLYPFYYINYTLTTMGAMEFKKKMREDKTSAWNDYMNLCKVGGSKSYLETLAYANLSDPFKPGSVKKAISFAKEILLSQI
ncbi:MAG: M3 family oligoendopeptidase [Candidatus Borkfalkiaceae bacterium]|nr:M3 family oligoendopeptidase [Christensenellaceae bacterium]